MFKQTGMKRNLATIFAIIGWFAVITQYILLIENRTRSVIESTIRFFGYFTILTNLLVAIYFTCLVFAKKGSIKWIRSPGTLTAITIYITMVGSIYQVALRHIWNPQGLQLLVDELLHSVIPALVIIFWYLYEITRPVKYAQIIYWAIYPLAYFVYILIHGSFSNFYPYPFIDVTDLGMSKSLSNAAVLLLIFIVVSALILFIGKKLIRR